VKRRSSRGKWQRELSLRYVSRHCLIHDFAEQPVLRLVTGSAQSNHAAGLVAPVVRVGQVMHIRPTVTTRATRPVVSVQNPYARCRVHAIRRTSDAVQAPAARISTRCHVCEPPGIVPSPASSAPARTRSFSLTPTRVSVQEGLKTADRFGPIRTTSDHFGLQRTPKLTGNSGIRWCG
jgi:hypothetical protein